MDSNALWDHIDEWRLWAVCGVAFALGALGGLIQVATSAETRAQLREHWWRRVLLGAVAAVAVIYVSDPETALAFVGGSLVAGYAGKALLDALEARQRIAVANARADENRRRADTATSQTRLALVARDRAVEAATIALDDGGLERKTRARNLLNGVRAPDLMLFAHGGPLAPTATGPHVVTDVKLVDYVPPANETIEVTSIIGNGQLGAWTVVLDGVFKGAGSGAQSIALGKGADLAGKILEVSAAISDERPEHNRLSLRVKLTGREAPIDIEHEVSTGDRAAYSIIVRFGA